MRYFIYKLCPRPREIFIFIMAITISNFKSSFANSKSSITINSPLSSPKGTTMNYVARFWANCLFINRYSLDTLSISSSDSLSISSIASPIGSKASSWIAKMGVPFPWISNKLQRRAENVFLFYLLSSFLTSMFV